MKLIKRLFVTVFFLSMLVISILYFGNDVLLHFENDDPSFLIQVGGREVVQNAKRLPSSGLNFETYSRIFSSIGRTHVHSQLRPVIVNAYALLAKRTPDFKYIYGETGWKNGGRFWPHRTHRNGLSVDFMVPVKDKESSSPTVLSLSPLNRWGYEIRFDAKGEYGDVVIAFDAIVAHLRALKEMSTAQGLRVKRVIFDPPLLEILKTQAGFKSLGDVEFMKGHAWFPHDSHYHVDFEIINAL